MPGPIRKPLAHPARATMITPAAVELYARAKRLIQRGEKQHRDELVDISRQLAVELKLRPWQTCPLDTIGFAGPSPWEGPSWWQSAALADELEVALRERRRAERARRKAAEPPPDQPTPPTAA